MRLQNRKKKTPAPVLIVEEDFKELDYTSLHGSVPISSQKKSRSLTEFLQSSHTDHDYEVNMQPQRKRIKWMDIDGTSNLENFEPIGTGCDDLNRQPMKPILKPTFDMIFPKQPKKKSIFTGMKFTAPKALGKASRIKFH
jgi:hypothetical protein